jgi:AcrR family transcriptional regulator
MSELAETDSRRLAVLRAADALLEARGLDGLTIRAVLDATGLARRAFYDLFASKDDLVLGLFEHTIAEAAVLLEREGARLAGPIERLRLVVFSIVGGPVGREPGGYDRRSAAFSREHLRLAEARPEELQRAIEPLVALIARQIADGAAAGHFRAGSPTRSAMFVYNLISSTVHTETLRLAAGQQLPGSRDQLAEDLWDFCRRALSN